MATAKLPNFGEEYEKLTQKLAFFEEAKAKNDLEVFTKSMDKHKREIQEISSKKAAVELEFEPKRLEFCAILSAFDKKETEWKRRGIDACKILFVPRIRQEDIFHNAQEFKDRIKLGKENLDMLEARLSLAEHVAATESFLKVLSDLKDDIVSKKKAVKGLEEEEKILRKEYDGAVDQWRIKYEVSNPTSISEVGELRFEVEAKDLEISNLNKQIAAMNNAANAQNTTTSFLSNNITENRPIHDVGLAILERRCELQKLKSDRNQAIIERRNKAAHFGSALADAHRVSEEGHLKITVVEW